MFLHWLCDQVGKQSSSYNATIKHVMVRCRWMDANLVNSAKILKLTFKFHFQCQNCRKVNNHEVCHIQKKQKCFNFDYEIIKSQ